MADRPAQVAYEHVRAVMIRDDEAHVTYIGKARHFLTVIVGLFAGLAFALEHATAWASGSTVHLWVIGVLSFFAAVSLAVAFWAGIRCLEIIDTRVVRVEKLQEVLEADLLATTGASKVYRDLAVNLAQAVNKNRADNRSRRRRGILLNRCTLVGAVLTALAVGWAVGGEFITRNTRIAMSERENPDNPSLVEPSDNVQSGGEPPEVSLVESSDTVQKGDTQSGEQR